MRLIREGIAIAALVFQLLVVWQPANRLLRVPTHYGISGRPNGYGPASSLWILPAISLMLYAVLTVVGMFPRSFNYPVPVTESNREELQTTAQSMLGWLKAEMMCLFAYISWRNVRVGLGESNGLGWGFLLVLAIIFATVTIGTIRMRRVTQ